MNKNNIITLFLILLTAFSCKTAENATANINDKELNRINSILQYGLDREALYTFLTDLKPMSSLMLKSYPLSNTDSLRKTKEHIVKTEHLKYLDSLNAIQKTIDKINIPDIKIVMVPYKQNVNRENLLVQLSVVRISALNQLLERKKAFFGQFGLVPGSDPYLVLSTIENADLYERYRGYGYLFGYPDYAVDFFVEASEKYQKTQQFQKRKFFQIPVFSGNEGHFVYAYPEHYTPKKEVDSTTYYKAIEVLNDYKKRRPQYQKSNGTINALQLIKDYHKKK